MALQRIKNAPRWDGALLAAPRASLLQSWRWGDFKRASGWLSIRVAVTPAAEDVASPDASLLLGAQLLFRKVPHLPVPVSIAYIPRGPVPLHAEELPEQVRREFWQAVHREAGKRGAIFLKVEPNIDVTEADLKAK